MLQTKSKDVLTTPSLEKSCSTWNSSAESLRPRLRLRWNGRVPVTVPAKCWAAGLYQVACNICCCQSYLLDWRCWSHHSFRPFWLPTRHGTASCRTGGMVPSAPCGFLWERSTAGHYAVMRLPSQSARSLCRQPVLCAFRIENHYPAYSTAAVSVSIPHVCWSAPAPIQGDVELLLG